MITSVKRACFVNDRLCDKAVVCDKCEFSVCC